MRKRSFLHVITLVVMCLSAFGVGPTAAVATGFSASVTAARICEDQSLEVRWIGDMLDMRVSASNTSDNWTSGWMQIPDLDDGIYSIPLGRNFDKVVVQWINPIFGEYHEEDTITIDTGTCADGAEEPRGDWRVAEVALTCSGLATVTILYPEAIPDGRGLGLLLHENGSPVGVGVVPFTLVAGQAEYRYQFDTSEWQSGAEIQASTFVPGMDVEAIYSPVITCDGDETNTISLTIRGHVTNADGTPAAYAHISMRFSNASDPDRSESMETWDGTFEFTQEVLANSQVVIFASDWSSLSGWQTIVAGDSDEAVDVDVVLSPIIERTISGQVTDDSGNPVEGAVIQLSCNLCVPGYDIPWVISGAGGSFDFGQVPVAPFELYTSYFSSPSNDTFYANTRTIIRDIEPGDILISVVLERQAGSRPTVRVVNENDDPIEGAYIYCVNCGGKESSDAPSRSSGGRADANGQLVWWDTQPLGPLEPGHVMRIVGYNDERRDWCVFSLDFSSIVLAEPGLMDLGTIVLDCSSPENAQMTIVPPSSPETPEVPPTETVPPTVEPTETVPPTDVPTETVPPTEVPTETATPDAENTLIVTITLPNGASIEGAPYDLYAPQAAIVFQTEPYRSGIVGVNNTIEIADLLPGTYKLVISPEGIAPIEAMIEIGDQPLTEIRLIVNADGSVTVEDVAQVTPTATAPADGDKKDDVTSLPSTGTGAVNGSMGVLVMLGIAASALVMAGGLAARLKRS